MCSCKYPVRAKEVRAKVFRDYIDDDTEATDNAYIYCETEKEQGHVYYGTFSTCVTGNDLSAEEMTSCKVFERYRSAS